ncbi:MAG TPA: hypothetical protein VKD90_20540 [Gemmataceae bacterium]|nr:hypothetical protein [Gemmataceae bacterium]
MPATTADKVIVTHLGRLSAKYKASGVTAIRAAVRRLITADKERGLTTVLVDLAGSADMKKYKAKAVPAANALDPRAAKTAIDQVFTTLKPSYLMLLGAPDVIPHQDLTNPVYTPGTDDDRVAWSDLPYACDAPYHRSIRKFLAPARVVGRLPDVTNGTDPAYLVRLLRAAEQYTERPAKDYDAFLGITTATWKDSTDESLRAVFGSAVGMKVAPPDAPPWSTADLAARAHFVNCHGAPASHQFYGEPGFAPSHDASLLPGKLADGTVMAAECCYGAELYDPALDGGQPGMCNTYLDNGGYAYFGSSTIAYGPPAGNAQADLICQDFLKHVRAGASAGRSALQARLDYVARAVVLSPVDLKTLAQFGLMGDPSLTPVRPTQPAPHVVPKGTAAKAMSEALAAVGRAARVARRATLFEMAEAVAASTLVVADAVTKAAGGQWPKGLDAVVRPFGLRAPEMLTVQVLGATAPKGKGGVAPKALAAAGAPTPTKVHTLLEREPAPGPAVLIRGVEVVEYGGSYEARAFVSR